MSYQRPTYARFHSDAVDPDPLDPDPPDPDAPESLSSIPAPKGCSLIRT